MKQKLEQLAVEGRFSVLREGGAFFITVPNGVRRCKRVSVGREPQFLDLADLLDDAVDDITDNNGPGPWRLQGASIIRDIHPGVFVLRTAPGVNAFLSEPALVALADVVDEVADNL